MAPKDEWQAIFQAIQGCNACASIQSSPQGKDKPVFVVNPLAGRTAEDWGIYWYDHFRNLNGRVMIVGMDFGDKPTVDEYRRTGITPGKEGDKTFGWLSQFIRSAQIGKEVYLTNAALCVRESNQASGNLSAKIYNKCLGHLRSQLDLVQPEIIITLGKRALVQVLKAINKRYVTSTFWPGKTITQFAGQEVTVVVNDRQVVLFPLIHPAFEQPLPLECPWNYERQEQEFIRVRSLLASKQ